MGEAEWGVSGGTKRYRGKGLGSRSEGGDPV